MLGRVVCGDKHINTFILCSKRFIFGLQVPKLVHQEIMQSSGIISSTAWHGVHREAFLKHFNIFSPVNVYQSVLPQENNSNGSAIKSGTFGFTHLMDLSPEEVSFLATGTFMEGLLFFIMRWDRQFLDGILDLLMEAKEDFSNIHLDSGKVRAVTRMLLLPSRSETNFLRRKLATGPGHSPFEALIVPHQDRLQADARLVHATYTFIPRTRAPPVCLFLFYCIFSFLSSMGEHKEYLYLY